MYTYEFVSDTYDRPTYPCTVNGRGRGMGGATGGEAQPILVQSGGGGGATGGEAQPILVQSGGGATGGEAWPVLVQPV